MKSINKRLLNKFIKEAAEQLSGDWVLIGGSAMLLMDIQTHPTMDIDIAGSKNAKQKDILTLMQIAEKLNLPIEAINQAGAFFLFSIKDWQKQLIQIHKGKNAIFFIPTPSLMILLKIKRMSEIDLIDCLNIVKAHRDLNFENISREIKNEIKKVQAVDKEKLERLKLLESKFQ